MKRKIYDHLGFRISSIKWNRYYNFEYDERETAPFKLIYFCGAGGINYLNAAMISVYKTWDKLPEIKIITDGTPVASVKEKLIKWPKKLEIITWEECALHYKSVGNINLYNYAANELWGKKLISILCSAEKYPILYSDTDILWFAYPKELDFSKKPYIKMGEDSEACYSEPMLSSLKEEYCLGKAPLNAGLIFANGDFSSYEKWEELCNYLSASPDFRTEQTTFAILNNFFNAGVYWNKKDVLIKTDDRYNLRFTQKDFPGIFARHYVGNKDVTFWKDFAFMCLTHKNLKNLSAAPSYVQK